MKFMILLLVFAILVTLDKALTIANLLEVKKTNPDYLTIEKNPAAKFFFEKFGLAGGTLIYGLISVGTLFLAYYFLKFVFSESASLWILCLLYALVIANNLFFLAKFKGWLG